MPPPTWTANERRDLFLFQVEYGLNDAQVHDMMGRIYGNAWKDAKRKQYNIADLRDECKFRWSSGKRNNQWRTIDPELLPHSPQEVQDRTASFTRIQSAAAQTGGRNWLTQRANQPITLPALQTYRRDPNTFDAVFNARNGQRLPRGQNSQAGPSQSTSTRPARPTASSSATRPARPARPAATAPPTRVIPSWYYAPPLTEEQRRSLSFRPWADDDLDQATREHKHSRVLNRDPSFRILPMVHQSKVSFGVFGLQVLDYYMDDEGTEMVISYEENSDVRDWGGQATTIWDSISKRKVDVLLCDATFCSVCDGTAIVTFGQDKLTQGVDIIDSPFHGLPFVHMGRDTDSSDDSGQVRFDQDELHGIPEPSIPVDTEETTVYFQEFRDLPNKSFHRPGVWMRVKVLECVADKCKVCTPGKQLPSRKRDKSPTEEADDHVEEEQEEGTWLDSDDDEPANDDGGDDDDEDDDDDEGSDFDDRPARSRRGKQARPAKKVKAA